MNASFEALMTIVEHVPLSFGEHPDVLFQKAPLESVLCQIRFSPVLALLDRTGVAGFQEALRSTYPEMDQDIQTTMAVTPQGSSLQAGVPNWRFSDSAGNWRTSIGVDFVALETSDAPGYRFEEFWNRLAKVLEALDRTVRVVSSRRVGLRKVNVLSHPAVASFKDWSGLLRGELLGLSAAPNMPNTLSSDYSEIHFPDESGGTLSIRHGVEPGDLTRYRLDLDYWTNRVIRLDRPERIEGLLDGYAKSMTSFFHWCLENRLFEFLEPRPRIGAE